MDSNQYTIPRPTLDQAVELVTEDHENWGCEDCQSSKDILRHVLDVLRLPESPAVPGGFPLEEEQDDDAVAYAYRVVLEEVK